jgi:hypothetical protein
MKYRMDEDQGRIDIHVGELGDDQGKALDAFQACQEGRCSCPTDEYQKLETLDIEPGDDSLTLHLTPKPGEELDPSEIEKCLDYTQGKLEG